MDIDTAWPDPTKTAEENNLIYVERMPGIIQHGHDILTMEQWREYFARLEGPEGCDFQESPTLTWKCGGGMDKSLSEAILRKMGLDENIVSDVLETVESLGGGCDCEILFNAAERIDP